MWGEFHLKPRHGLGARTARALPGEVEPTFGACWIRTRGLRSASFEVKNSPPPSACEFYVPVRCHMQNGGPCLEDHATNGDDHMIRRQ